MVIDNTCVVIMSCDKYADLWKPFFHFFNKYWSDCPFKIYLSTNNKDYKQSNVMVLKSGINTNWSDETIINIKKINYEYIIYLQDDYLFLKKVNTAVIVNLIEKMSHFRCDYLRLFPSPGPDELFNHDTSLGLISKNAPYRTSLQAAIWKKATFEALLKPGENPWQFEINSPERSKQFLFLSVLLNKDLHIKKQIFPITYHYLTAVLKGKWVYSMKQTLKNEGIVIDEKTRKIESYKEKVYSKIYNSVPLFIKKILDYITKLRN